MMPLRWHLLKPPVSLLHLLLLRWQISLHLTWRCPMILLSIRRWACMMTKWIDHKFGFDFLWAYTSSGCRSVSLLTSFLKYISYDYIHYMMLLLILPSSTSADQITLPLMPMSLSLDLHLQRMPLEICNVEHDIRNSYKPFCLGLHITRVPLAKG